LISQLTSLPETIPSRDRRLRHIEFQPILGRHLQLVERVPISELRKKCDYRTRRSRATKPGALLERANVVSIASYSRDRGLLKSPRRRNRKRAA